MLEEETDLEEEADVAPLGGQVASLEVLGVDTAVRLEAGGQAAQEHSWGGLVRGGVG